MPSRSRRRPPVTRLALRWLALGGICLVVFLYYRPLRTYLDTRSTLAQRSAEVKALRATQRALERRLATSTSDAELAREARRLGLVKPGEHLYIVKGIPGWLRAHASRIEGRG